MTAKQYASFILKTGLEFGMKIFHLNSVFCYTEDEAKNTMINTEIPEVNWVIIDTKIAQRSNIFRIIDDWNVRYFSTAAAAEQARKEFLEIIAIEDKETRLKEYDNWYAERSSWSV